jgi:drug/metabolite transporter (DMT)-like permease
MNYYLFGIAAGFDFFGTTFSYIGLNFISPSIYTMIRGGQVIITAILSMKFLNKKLKKHQIAGCCSVFIGIVTVGVSNFVFGNSENTYSVHLYFYNNFKISLKVWNLNFCNCNGDSISFFQWTYDYL